MDVEDLGAEVLLLGPVELRPSTASLGGEKAKGVLALLALSAGQVVPVERLIDGVWGEDPPAEAQNAVQYHVSQLRKSLPGGREGSVLLTRPPGYLLRLETDWARFQRGTVRAAALGPDRRDQAVRLLADALRLWRGPALADLRRLPVGASRGPALDGARLHAVESLAQFGVDGPDPASWVLRLEELVAEHPTRERFWALLMLALYRTGQQVQALDTYRRLRRSLKDELGVEPSADLRELQARILAQDDDLLARPGIPAGRPHAWRGLDLAELISTRRRTDVDEEQGRLELVDGRVIPLRGPVRIGRSSDCEVVLDDPDVSRRHAEIVAAGGGWAVRDLGSTNGTELNRQPVHGSAVLHPGDRLTIGATEIRYRSGPT